MRRYWIDKKNFKEDRVLLQGQDYHHIITVCRLDVGNKFEVLTGDSFAYLVELRNITKKEAKALVIEKRAVAKIKQPYIHLMLSIPKFSTLESILEKAVELGVSEMTLFSSEFSFIRKLPGRLENKYQRWEKILQSATQQTGRAEKMKLNQAVSLEKSLEIFNQSANAAGLFAYEGEAVLELPQALERLSNEVLENIFLFVGSEGGFSYKEVSLFSGAGLQSVSMGAQVLRVETACIALTSILKYHFRL